jgi:hypothetical protein
MPMSISRGLRVKGSEGAGSTCLRPKKQVAVVYLATAQERVMVTSDTDYLELHQSGVQHAGIAWCPEQKYDVGELIRALLLLHGVLDRQSMLNHVEYL